MDSSMDVKNRELLQLKESDKRYVLKNFIMLNNNNSKQG